MKALLLLPFLASCAPYVGYTHLDPTPMDNDKQAHDLICGGVKIRKAVEVSIGACGNVRGGEFFRIDVEYVHDD